MIYFTMEIMLLPTDATDVAYLSIQQLSNMFYL
jgi:hypothetical protein